MTDLASERAAPTVVLMSDDEARALFDEQARKTMGMSGEEFLRRWDGGEFDALVDDPDHPEVLRLAMLDSFGR